MVKWLALLAMVIDHLGAVFFPGIGSFHLVGRFAMPVFAVLVGVNAARTSNRGTYRNRLIALAFISQPFFFLLFDSSQLNILATLALGVVFVELLDTRKPDLLHVGAVVLIPFVEYGVSGVALVILAYLAWVYRPAFYLLPLLAVVTVMANPLPMAVFALLGLMAAWLAVFFSAWSRPPGAWSKYFFYAFYPAHLAVFNLLRVAI